MGNSVWTKVSIAFELVAKWSILSFSIILLVLLGRSVPAQPRDMVGGVCTKQSHLSPGSVSGCVMAEPPGYPVDKQVFSQLPSSRLDTSLSIAVALSSPIQGFKYLRQNYSSIKLENKASVWGQPFPSDFLPEVIQVRDLGFWWAVAWEQEISLVFRGPTLPEGTLRNCYLPTHISLCGIHSMDPHGLPGIGN